MKESELNDKISSDVKTEVTDQIKNLLEEQVNPYVKDQLKEQLDDAVKSAKDQILPVDKDLKEAEEKAAEFKTGGEFLTAVYMARNGRGIDPRLSYLDSKNKITKAQDIAQKTAGHMEIGEDAQGGFLVPEIYRMDLQQIALENSIVRQRATILPMTTDSLKIPYVDDISHASTVFGGVSATWTAEAGTKTAVKPTFGQMELTPQVVGPLGSNSYSKLVKFGEAFAHKHGNPEPSLNTQEGVETIWQASFWDGEIVQTTNA